MYFKNGTAYYCSLLLLCCIMALGANSQQSQLINLNTSLLQKNILVINRDATVFTENEKEGIKLSEQSGEGLALIKNVRFDSGTIEVDLKGKDEFQQSFLGIAFHVQNDSTYDAVYFRPFNFRTTDSVRRIHAVQYIAHPQYTWKRLRDERNARFEKAVDPVPDPNNWFHARIEVTARTVKVYVNGAAAPSLVVTKLNDFTSGGIALWTGDSAGGSFANLTIKPSIANKQ